MCKSKSRVGLITGMICLVLSLLGLCIIVCITDLVAGLFLITAFLGIIGVISLICST